MVGGIVAFFSHCKVKYLRSVMVWTPHSFIYTLYFRAKRFARPERLFVLMCAGAEKRRGARRGARARKEEPGRAELRINALLFMILSTRCRVLMPHSITEKEQWNLDATDVNKKKKKKKKQCFCCLYH